MSAVDLYFGRNECWELPETDWDGSQVPRQEATFFVLQVPFQIEGVEPDKAFTLTTTARAEIPQRGLPKGHGKAANLVANLAAKELVATLPTRKRWRSFIEEKLHLDPVRSSGDPENFSSKITPTSITVPTELYKQLATDATILERTTTAYEKAKNRLFALATTERHHGLTQDAHEIRTLLNFLDGCNTASANCRMDRWYAEKMPRVRREFDDLIGRKNTSHPGYERAAKSASGMIYSFNAPYAYSKTPPSPHLAEKFLQ
ncbi:MAG: hypothetical protein INR62_03090 [Rhodospirillales bacterium]|nr:hypothetical protein [Acetobacter sp.]